MCFETNKLARAKRAKEDIICWKWLEDEYTSPFCDYVYKIDVVTPPVKIKKNVIPFCGINRYGISETHYSYAINEGYHSYKSREMASCQKGFWGIVFKFIIPKGTRYYENNTEYVSEQIIFTGEKEQLN